MPLFSLFTSADDRVKPIQIGEGIKRDWAHIISHLATGGNVTLSSYTAADNATGMTGLA